MFARSLFGIAFAVAAMPVQSKVVSAADHGFEVRHEALINQSAAEAWARIGRIQS